MNEQLVKQSAEILELLKQGIITGKDIAVEQLPEICQQLISYEIIFNIIMVLFFIALSIVISFFMKPTFNKIKTEKYNDGWVGLFMVECIGLISSILVTLTSIVCLIKAIVAPKVFLIEKLASLFK